MKTVFHSILSLYLWGVPSGTLPLSLCVAAAMGCVVSVSTLAAEVKFDRDVRPILSDRCYQCHGPDAESRKADLRLDLPDTSYAANPDSATWSGWASVVDVDEPQESELLRRIETTDASEQMPPPDSHRRPLSPQERQVLRSWVAEGAPMEQFWAFKPTLAQVPPKVADSKWPADDLDRFVLAALESHQRQPSKEAGRRTLLRRLSLDITGLPPTIQQLRNFEADSSPNAYEAEVDRLLASPQYGEHMAKYWLDLVRFADTNGIHHDHYREMSPYRDWVIRSFNQNLPFDRFAEYQVAGDLLPDPSQEQLIASGFNRLHLVIDRGTALPEESHVRNVVDRTTAFGTAFMGLTVGCAVCHDHKYDPITQRDFYQLYAFFNNIDAEPETPGRDVHEPALRLPSPEQEAELQRLDDSIKEAASNVKKLQPDKSNAAADAEVAASSTQQLEAAKSTLASLTEERKRLIAAIPVSLIMKERTDVRPAHILIRGAYDRPGQQVSRGTPSFLPPLQSRSELPDRLDLAKWITDPEHPLMARVTVNRIWQQFFGTGLVRTSEDFGAQGEMPSHPELLDYLSNEFVRSDWDVKELVKRIVCSATYRQTSQASPEDFRTDPSNRQLARGSRFRLDSEVIRDQILFTTGLLNQSLYGKSVKPPQPADLWKNVSMVSSSTYSFQADSGADIYRRSLYTFWKRALPPPQMTIFDAPTRESCIARRERTNTPLQALVLMNEGVFFDAAVHLARNVVADSNLDSSERLAKVYELITSHIPAPAEQQALESAYSELLSEYREHAGQAQEIVQKVAQEPLSDEDAAVTAAMALVINGIFNLDIVKTHQ